MMRKQGFSCKIQFFITSKTVFPIKAYLYYNPDIYFALDGRLSLSGFICLEKIKKSKSLIRKSYYESLPTSRRNRARGLVGYDVALTQRRS